MLLFCATSHRCPTILSSPLIDTQASLLLSYFMSTHAPDRVIAIDSLPAPATKLVITRCFQWSNNPPFWALLVTGKFYNAAGRVIWSTEVFLGQLSWLGDADSSSQSDTESNTASDSSSEESSHSITPHSDQDIESEDEGEQLDSESSSGEAPLNSFSKRTESVFYPSFLSRFHQFAPYKSQILT